MKTVIFHHNDADGRCGAAILGRSGAFDDNLIKKEIVYVECDYGKLKDSKFVDEAVQLAEGNNVYVVDFSFELPTMDAMYACAYTFTWIDHHASRKDMAGRYRGITDFNDKGMSGCELAWRWAHPGELMPDVVKLIGDYDSWRLEYEDACKSLITALDAYQYGPEDSFWDRVIANKAHEDQLHLCINDGRAMVSYKNGYTAGCRKQFGWEATFHGLKCYALNLQRMGSMMFGPEMASHDACLAYCHDGERFTVSMYSEKPEVNCAEICKRNGGGGHKGAAGFTCDTLPFIKEMT